MDSKRLEEVIRTLEGMTYLDWKKVSHAIDRYWQVRTSEVNHKLTLADSDLLRRLLKDVSLVGSEVLISKDERTTFDLSSGKIDCSN